MSVPQILIVGPGAIGGALAARWIESGVPVGVLGRSPRSERALASRGLWFTGTSGRRRRVSKGLVPARSGRPAAARAVFLCVKSYKTAEAISAVRPFVGPRTAVVGLQNGVGQQELLRRAFGARAVIGICYIAADRTAPGQVVHHGGKDVHLARRGGNDEAVASARHWLERGGWTVTLEDDEPRMLWTKLCFNAAGNPLGAVCAATNGQLVRDPALREILLMALREAVTLARRAGHRLRYEQMARMVVKSYPNDSLQRNSMLQDLQARRRTEIDSIVGPLLAARRAGRPKAPVLERLSGLVRRLERLP